ncbi:MAG: type II toxin-antitoxin system VapC family toxin [Calditrichia bacterium]
MKIILDTNAALYFLQGNERVIANVSNAEKVAVSFITEIELLCYETGQDEIDTIKKFLTLVEILYPDAQTAKLTIDIRKKSGLKLPDAIICAQAAQFDYTLFTSDKKILNQMPGARTLDPRK